MLVLSRQRDETIMIGDEIEITVVDIRGDKVRLGITAPTRIAVHRKEVYDAIRRENEHAAQFDPRPAPADLDALRRALSPGPAKTRAAASPARSRPAGLTAGSAPPARPARDPHTPPTPAADGRQTA